MKAQSLLMTLAIFLGHAAFAADAHHAEGGIPTIVYWQVLNLAIVIAGIIYFSKDAISDYLVQNRKSYEEQAERFLKTKKEAEERYTTLQNRMQTLERDYTQNIQQAHLEAEKIKNQMIADAQETVRRIQQDAKEVGRIEVERAKREIKEQMIKEAHHSAQQVLSKDISGGDQQKLHDGFVHNIQSI